MAEKDSYTDVPTRVRDLDERGVMVLKQSVLSLHDDDENEVADVSCGAGLGGDFVLLRFKGRQGIFFLRDVLAEWVASFDAEEAKQLPRKEKKEDQQ